MYMTKISNLIYAKGNTVFTIDASKSVFDALEMMVARNIGAVVVYKEGEYAGLLTERDYARKIILKGKNSQETLVSEIMQDAPTTIGINDSVEHCMEIMSDKRIRYLPVLADNHVVALVSMGDLVRFIMNDQRQTIDHLQNFIRGM
jgi:CBS domain-containing protein